MDGDVLVVGESLVDVVTTVDGVTTERPGGSAANVAVALARLGRPVRFATAYADDAYGRMLAAHLAGSAVAYAGDPLVLDRTASAAATIGPDGSASYVFDVDWRLGRVEVGAPAFVHVCSLGAVLEPGSSQVLELLQQLQQRVQGATVLYDVNARPAITGVGPEIVARVEEVARCADLVKASDEDLTALYPGSDLDDVAEHLRSLGPRAVVVTRGASGATWHDSGATYGWTPQGDVAVVDTIGAGDTFSAGIIDALWRGLGPEQTLAHAGRAAAITVSRPGADPPTLGDLGLEADTL